MYEVLVPVDDDANRALQQARYVASLAATGDVAATVVTAVAPSAVDGTTIEGHGAAAAAVDHLEAAGVDVTGRVEGGTAARAIVDVAEETDADELVLGGRRRSGVARVLLGSTVYDVFVSTDRPVTITGREMTIPEHPEHVLVPVDGTVERARRQAEYVVDRPTIPAATVLHVFRHQDYAGAPPHEFDEVESAVAAADRLEEAGIDVDRLAIGGEIAQKILETADTQGTDALVIGGRKRSGIQKVVIGSTAQDLLLSADRPITLSG